MTKLRTHSYRIVVIGRNEVCFHLRRPGFEHEWIECPHTHPEETVERLRNADIAIVRGVCLGERELSQLPTLRLIAVASAECGLIDLAACQRRNVTVTNVSGLEIDQGSDTPFPSPGERRRRWDARMESRHHHFSEFFRVF